MKRRERWKFAIPREERVFKGGPAALARVKKWLEPFSEQHNDYDVCRCERCADKKIKEAAQRYMALRHLAVGAPRPEKVLRNLADIGQKARQFAVSLAALDDYSREWLFVARKPTRILPDMRPLHKKANAKRLPPPAEIAEGDGILVQELLDLSAYAEGMRRYFDTWRWLDAPYGFEKDVGGNSNMVTQWFGAPNEKLVIDAYWIFQYFKSSEFRKTEHGSFHNFVLDLRFYVSGSRKGETSIYPIIKRKYGPKGELLGFAGQLKKAK